MTTTLASSSHEIINPANVIQPRAVVIAEAVADLLNSASACIAFFSVSAVVTRCSVARSTTSFDGRRDETEPVPPVECNSQALPLGSTPVDTGRAFRFRGRGGRLFFMAYVSYTLQSPQALPIRATKEAACFVPQIVGEPMMQEPPFWSGALRDMPDRSAS